MFTGSVPCFIMIAPQGTAQGVGTHGAPAFQPVTLASPRCENLTLSSSWKLVYLFCAFQNNILQYRYSYGGNHNMTQNNENFINSKPSSVIWSWVFTVAFLGAETWLLSKIPIPSWQVIIGICGYFLVIFFGFWVYGWLYHRPGLRMLIGLAIATPLLVGYIVNKIEPDALSKYLALAFRYGLHLMLLSQNIYGTINTTLIQPLSKREGRAIEIVVEHFLNAVKDANETLISELTLPIEGLDLKLGLLTDYLPDENNSDIVLGRDLHFGGISGSGLPVWLERIRCSAVVNVSWQLDRAGKSYHLYTELAKSPSGWKMYDVMIFSAVG